MLEDQVNRDKLRIRELEKEVLSFKEEVHDLKATVQAQDLKIQDLTQIKGQKVVIINPAKVLEEKYIRFIAKSQNLGVAIPGIYVLKLQTELKG